MPLRLLSGVLAGAAGTAAMTITGRLHRELYARRRGVAPSEITEILDYDDSDHVVVAASRLLQAVSGRAPESSGARRALFWLVHWGYGSAVGVAHAELRHRLGEPTAGIAFFLGCQTMALSLFPVLGGTPAPWRWTPRLMTTSLAQHVVYAGAVAGADAALARG
ncbi:hypothetical protein [Actinomycetospora termitidis]|uniref:DUF1440 domain-containing protein n=1 Tax=Actinomycetospora termitidis TaxID=3053470 RepID=A0ABT7M4F4_9PSEU|nr:hypothetical protein [Actinomycetospora sp. Odt1-22]MDL5155551.1 hypothetical protein [Actinomycetospora sp. Odt1-22]